MWHSLHAGALSRVHAASSATKRWLATPACSCASESAHGCLVESAARRRRGGRSAAERQEERVLLQHGGGDKQQGGPGIEQAEKAKAANASAMSWVPRKFYPRVAAAARRAPMWSFVVATVGGRDTWPQ